MANTSIQLVDDPRQLIHLLQGRTASRRHQIVNSLAAGELSHHIVPEVSPT